MRLKKKKFKPDIFCFYWKLLFGFLSTFETIQVGKEERDEKKNKRRRAFHILRAQSDAYYSHISIGLGNLCLFYNYNRISTMEKEIRKSQICLFLERGAIFRLYYLRRTGTKYSSDRNYQDTEMYPRKFIHSNHPRQEQQCKTELGELLRQSNRELTVKTC